MADVCMLEVASSRCSVPFITFNLSLCLSIQAHRQQTKEPPAEQDICYLVTYSS